MKHYDKPPTNYDKQIDMLSSRGLIIEDREIAVNWLKQINYYRFSAYCLPFESSRHSFISDVRFEDVIDLYHFDRSLRSIIDEALEIVEVSLRSTTAYHLGHTYGAFAHTDPKNFFDKFDHAGWIEKIHDETDRSRELFISHYKATYKEFPDIPIWVVVEVMSFGRLVRLINNLKRNDQKKIASIYGLHHRIFCSWILAFLYVRNICAHHSRIIDKELRIKMTIPNNKNWQRYILKKKIGMVIVALDDFMDRIGIDNSEISLWREKLINLFNASINHLDINKLAGIKKGLQDIFLGDVNNG
jgi:abortive infection bacteriophage resistance protein